VEHRPAVNDTVVLHDPSGREYPSRVEGLADGTLTVGRPLDLPPGRDLDLGAELLVSWKVKGGVAVLPTTLAGTRSEDGVGLWALTVLAPGWVEQRRRYVRVPATGAVFLRPGHVRSISPAVRGTLVDLSEGALRCTIEPAQVDQPVLGESIFACFTYGDLDLAIPARVDSRRSSTHQEGVTHLIVIFDEPNRDADALRKQIFTHQRRALRAP